MTDLRITVLGSGTIAAPHRRNPSGYLLYDVEQKSYALLDCGPGILKQICSMGIEPIQIGTVFLSHYHIDHCSDLLALLLNRYLHDSDSNMTLTVAGPNDIREWFAAQAVWQGSWMNEKGPSVLPVEEIGVWKGWKIESCLTGHTYNSLAFMFSKKGKRFFYSGDSGYNSEITKLAQGADLAICECAVPDDKPREGHMTPADLLRLAEQAQPKKLLATHIYPHNDPPEFAHTNTAISIAHDMQLLEI